MQREMIKIKFEWNKPFFGFSPTFLFWITHKNVLKFVKIELKEENTKATFLLKHFHGLMSYLNNINFQIDIGLFLKFSIAKMLH